MHHTILQKYTTLHGASEPSPAFVTGYSKSSLATKVNFVSLS